MKKKVLFICVHNSARSQMAAAWLNDICGDYFEGHSAGLEPGELNPLAVQVMDEIGIDISNNNTQAVFDVFERSVLPVRRQFATSLKLQVVRFFPVYAPLH
jgi:arsenate reductase